MKILKLKSYYKSFLRGFSSQREFRDFFSEEVLRDIQILLNHLQKGNPQYRLFFFSEYSLDFPTATESFEIESRAKEVFSSLEKSPLSSGRKKILYYFIFSEWTIINIQESTLYPNDVNLQSVKIDASKPKQTLSALYHFIFETFSHLQSESE